MDCVHFGSHAPQQVCGVTAWAFPATAELFQEDQAEGEEPPQAP